MAIAGAVLAVFAAAHSSLPLLLVGLFAFGAATACGLQARYAAADLALPEHRGRALSLVVWATTLGSVVGPNLAGPGADLGRRLGLPALGGAFAVSAVVFGVVALGLGCCCVPTPCCWPGGWAAGAPGRGRAGPRGRPCARCGPRRAAGSGSPPSSSPMR